MEDDLDQELLRKFKESMKLAKQEKQEKQEKQDINKQEKQDIIKQDKQDINKQDIIKQPKNEISKKKIKDEKKLSALKSDCREIINIVFIGHVDAGKSTIGGHLLLLTGMVDKRTMEKYEKEAKEKNRESWYLSWALDTNVEERDKGKTVEVGKAHFETKNKRIVLLDAPGHKGFVPNMISGAAQADIAILVISARKGEFETGFEKGGQTREHALIAKIAGSKFLIIIVNKMDDSTVNWNYERYNEIELKLIPFLKKIGFKLNEMFFMPCSGFTGANLKDKISKSICNWYDGPSLLDYIDSLPSFNQNLDLPARILISDRYKEMGTIVICKVVQGFLGKDDTFMLLPCKKLTKIINILSIDDIELDVARVGENIKLRLLNIEESDIPLGSILCSPNNLCETSTLFDAQLLILDCKTIIVKGAEFIIHIHNAMEQITLVGIHHKIDKKTGEKKDVHCRYVKQDDACVARLRVSNLICLAPFSISPELGRFTLRDEERTVAVGKIIKVSIK